MKKYDVAAFIWPAYTGDEPRTLPFWPEGMGEWQSVKNAQAKFEGHRWPRKPRWGYVNEADPYVMEMEINAAADHGINVFIYDWYWYDGRPFLENCLNDGYLKARNNDRVKFYLMWANHDVGTLWDIRISHEPQPIFWTGVVNRQEFERIALRNIEKYFKLPNYYKIDGKPVFMIYDTCNFVRGMGGVAQAVDALNWFQEQAVKAGLPGIHLQSDLWEEQYMGLTGVDSTRNVSAYDLLRELPYQSATHYQFVHYVDMNRDYLEILKDVQSRWKEIDASLPVTYFPQISVGWDNNPRFRNFVEGITTNNTPENFEMGLRMAKEYIDTHELPAPLVTINSWNEWTESSYLEPDNLNGYGYLEAVRRVFMEEGR